MQVWLGTLLAVSLDGSAAIVVHFTATNLISFPGGSSRIPVYDGRRLICRRHRRIRDVCGIIKVTHRTEVQDRWLYVNFMLFDF